MSDIAVFIPLSPLLLLLWFVLSLPVVEKIDRRYNNRGYEDLTLIGKAVILPWILTKIADRTAGKLIWKGDTE